jgi:hypothetical protein
LREVAGDDLFGGGVAEAERGRDEPLRWEVAVEVAGTLSALGESLEDGGEGLVRVTVRGCTDPDNGGLQHDRVPAYELVADVEESAERRRRGEGIEVGVVEGGEDLSGDGSEHGGNQRVTRGEVGVDGLAGDARSGGEVVAAGVAAAARRVELRSGDDLDAGAFVAQL